MTAGDHPSKTVQRNSNLETIVEVRTSALLGAVDDTAGTDATQSGSVIVWLKGIVSILSNVWDQTLDSLGVSLKHALDYDNDIIGSVPQRRSDAWQDQSVPTGEDASTAIPLVAAVSGEKHYLTHLRVTAVASCVVHIEDGDAAYVSGEVILAAGQTVTFDFSGNPRKAPTANKALSIKSSTVDKIHWDAAGYTMPDPS